MVTISISTLVSIEFLLYVERRRRFFIGRKVMFLASPRSSSRRGDGRTTRNDTCEDRSSSVYGKAMHILFLLVNMRPILSSN